MDVSDLESVDDLKELEERLYGLIHHEAVQFEDEELLVGESADLNCYQSTGKNQDHTFDSETAGAAPPIKVSKKLNHLDKVSTLQDRTQPMTKQSPLMEDGENRDCRSSISTIASNFERVDSLPLNDKQKEKNQQPKKKLQKLKNDKIKLFKNERNNFNRNARILQGNQKSVKEMEVRGPFGKQIIKLEKLKRIEAKKGKSQQVRNKRVERQQCGKQERVTEIIDLDTYGEDDDVIHVPLPAPPIIDVEDSIGDEEKKNQQIADNETTIETASYIEENALDAADVELPIADMRQKTPLDVTPVPGNQIAICNSPSSSILSTDDFIGQKDRRRLNNNFVDPGADDEDLILLTSDVSAFLKPITAQKDTLLTNLTQPCTVPADKESYRVEQNQLRSIDVYDSESDITESGVYSKTKSGQKATIIRSVDSSSNDEDDNVQIVESSATSAQKNKVFRKRRSSNSKKDSVLHITEGIDAASNSGNSDDEEMYPSGLNTTGVPYISRGIAVERCNWGERRRPSESAMSDNRFIESLNNLAKGEQANNEWSNPEPMHAEELERSSVAKEKVKLMPTIFETRKPNKENKTASRDVVADDSLAMPMSACKGLEEIFDQIDSMKADTKTNEDDTETVPITDMLPKDAPIIRIDDNGDKTDETICSKSLGWNNEMKCFYNDSWLGDDFNLNQLLAKLENRQQLWKLRLIDRFPKSTQRSNVKCFNCCEFGHVRSKCKQPKKKIVCSTCGETGHNEARCPQSMCLGCGHRTQLYVRSCNNCSFERRLICPLCKVRGHGLNSCPDKWRRYHSTTQMNVPLENKVKYKEKKHCSICGAIGHLAEICKISPRFMDYPSVISTIKSHRKVYDDRTDVGTLPEASSASERFNFKWRKPLQSRSYYVRFLKAVGLDYNLKRKSKNGSVQGIPKKKSKIVHPTLKSRILASLTSDTPPPNQVQEVSESCSTDEQTDTTTIKQIESGIDGDGAHVHKNRFKAPMNVERTIATSSTAVVEVETNEKELLQNFDSDSNYSFSEHFELPSSTTTFPAVRSKTPQVNGSSGVMDNLPEMIPLVSDEKSDKYSNDNFMPTISGISMCFSGELPENNYPTSNRVTNEEVACECKIYLQDSDNDFLLSPNGHMFLTNMAKLCYVNVRMELSSIGHVLVVYGMPKNQTQLHLQLLKKCKEERNKMLGYQIQMPPKRVDVLIKFLREGICQLFNNLGNANDHHKELLFQEKQNTKNGNKAADKKRRLLNMILLGQAGLLDGNMHLDELLRTLQRLITEFESNELASDNLRNDVEKHWRLIFTPYKQDDYFELLRNYSKLTIKNRLFTLHIDPRLLGQKVLNTTINREQQISRPISSDTNNTAFNKNRGINADLLEINTSVSKSSGHLRQDSIHQKTTPKRALESKLPCANPGQLSNINLQISNKKNTNIDTLLPNLEASRGPINKSSRANQPSMFWSREALRYVDKCLRLTTNSLYVSRLNRVQAKSQNGHLSHNDYCAIVRLYYSLANN